MDYTQIITATITALITGGIGFVFTYFSHKNLRKCEEIKKEISKINNVNTTSTQVIVNVNDKEIEKIQKELEEITIKITKLEGLKRENLNARKSQTHDKTTSDKKNLNLPSQPKSDIRFSLAEIKSPYDDELNNLRKEQSQLEKRLLVRQLELFEKPKQPTLFP